MKELSIEEKIKAYDEAIKRANELHDSYACIVESIFPELKESKDEMVRKAIIEHFEGSHSSMYPYKGFTKEQILAWLEKQGQTFTKKDVDDAYLKGIYDAKQELEKQGEQKPAWSEEDKKMLDRLLKHFEWTGKYRFDKKDCDDARNWLKSLKDRGVSQLKQEWNEEDDKIALSIEQIFNCASLLNIVPDKIEKVKSWLKNLKNRVQPEQEWSEEDEEQFSFCCAAIELSNYSSEEYRNYAISFLESLKDRVQPQPQWKPSEEQIKALKEAACYSSVFSEKTINNLISLSKQLKKLMEE